MMNIYRMRNILSYYLLPTCPYHVHYASYPTRSRDKGLLLKMGLIKEHSRYINTKGREACKYIVTEQGEALYCLLREAIEHYEVLEEET